MAKTIFAAIFSLLLASASAQETTLPEMPSKPSHVEEFRQSIQKLAPGPSDFCNWNGIGVEVPEAKDVESRIFDHAAAFIEEELNTLAGAKQSPHERASGALLKLEKLSAELLAAWPEDRRFHGEIIDLPPALIATMRIRDRGTFTFFALTEEIVSAHAEVWTEVGQESDPLNDWPPNLVDIRPLHRGPSGYVRFLAAYQYSGCAGSFGVAYDAYQWNPDSIASLNQVIKQSGSFGLDQVPAKPTAKNPFPSIGKLQTEGPLITLPYCWFSAIDTWDNPSMCAVDTYDVSGDTVKFRSRAFNRPDLVPIVKAIEHAVAHDYPATLAYCASADIARRLVRDVVPYNFADDLRVTRTGEGREHVEFGFDVDYRFDVQKIGGRWVIVAFRDE